MKLFDIIVDAVITVEKEFGAGQGESKKEQVINVVNAVVDIPYIPEFLEKKILSLLIDLIVYMFNRYQFFKTE